MYISRSEIIKRRSGKDLDNVVGPCVVCISLVVALAVNFGMRVSLEISCLCLVSKGRADWML